MSNHSDLTHLVSKWQMWVADQLDIKVPAFCGVTQRHWDPTTPEAGHETAGSAPDRMCPVCLDVYDLLIRARDEEAIRAATDVREAL